VSLEYRPGDQEELKRLDDAELVARVNRGDEEAFAALYDRHKDWVAALAYRWTGDREAALDVLQETFLYFIRKFPGFRLTARLQTFLYPAIKNLSIAARRKAGRYDTVEPGAPVLEELTMPEGPANEESQLRAVLSLLPETHREVLWLRYVDGLELMEIAMALEIPLGTVKSRLHNALTILRKDERTRKLLEE